MNVHGFLKDFGSSKIYFVFLCFLVMRFKRKLYFLASALRVFYDAAWNKIRTCSKFKYVKEKSLSMIYAQCWEAYLYFGAIAFKLLLLAHLYENEKWLKTKSSIRLQRYNKAKHWTMKYVRLSLLSVWFTVCFHNKTVFALVVVCQLMRL